MSQCDESLDPRFAEAFDRADQAVAQIEVFAIVKCQSVDKDVSRSACPDVADRDCYGAANSWIGIVQCLE